VVIAGALACSPRPAPQAEQAPPGDHPDTGDAVDSAAPTDTGTPCAPGELLDGERCVPDHCGVGTWGDLPDDDAAVHVLATAADGGDGSRASPLRTVLAALATPGAQGGGLIHVGEGTYAGELDVMEQHAGLTMLGRCAALVEIAAGPDDLSAMFVSSLLPEDPFRFEGITLRSGYFTGALFGAGAFTMRDFVVLDPGSFGLVLSGPNSADISGLVVRETRDEPPGDTHAVSASTDAVLVLRDSEFHGIHGVALTAGVGGVVDASGISILDSGPRSWNREGALSTTGGELRCVGCRVEDAVGIAVSASERSGLLMLTDLQIDAVRAREGEPAAAALVAGTGARIVVEGGTLTELTGVGVEASGGAEVALSDVHIMGIQPAESGAATALGAIGGSLISTTGLRLEDVSGSGVYAIGADTRVTLQDAEMVRVGHADGLTHGGGAVVADGAQLEWRGGTIEDTTAVAIEIASGQAIITDLDIQGIQPGLAVDGFDAALGPALVLAGGGARIERLQIEGATGLGILAVDGAELDIDTMHISGTAEAGGDRAPVDVLLAQGATLAGADITLGSVAAWGLWAQEPGTTAVLHTTTLGPSARPGVATLDGARLRMVDAAFDSRSRVAAYAGDPGTTLELERATISGTRDDPDHRYGLGVVVLAGAEADLDTVQVIGTDGPGLAVESSTATCVACEFTDNVVFGVASLGGDLTLVGGQVMATRADPDVGGYGVWGETSSGAGSLTLEDVEVDDNATAGVWLEGPGAWRLDGGRVAGGAGWAFRGGRTVHGDAVVARRGTLAWDGTRGLRIAGTALEDSAGAAVVVHGGGGTLVAPTFEGNTEDLRVQGCDGAGTGVDGAPSGITATLCPEAGDRFLLDPDIGLVVDLGGLTSD
jgi:hypothetical protein